MTDEEIITAHKAGKVLIGLSIECANRRDREVAVCDTEGAAKAYCRSAFHGYPDITIVDFDETDMEVDDPDGYYSGSHGRYSVIPMMYPVVLVD